MRRRSGRASRPGRRSPSPTCVMPGCRRRVRRCVRPSRSRAVRRQVGAVRPVAAAPTRRPVVLESIRLVPTPIRPRGMSSPHLVVATRPRRGAGPRPPRRPVVGRGPGAAPHVGVEAPVAMSQSVHRRRNGRGRRAGPARHPSGLPATVPESLVSRRSRRRRRGPVSRPITMTTAGSTASTATPAGVPSVLDGQAARRAAEGGATGAGVAARRGKELANRTRYSARTAPRERVRNGPPRSPTRIRWRAISRCAS